MKKIIFAAAALSTIASAPAFASDTDTQDLLVTATVPQECSIGNVADVTFAAVNINQNAEAGALMINGNSNSSQSGIWTSCNYAAKITVAGTPLLNTAGATLAANDPTNFTNSINYFVSFEAGSNGGFSKVVHNTRSNGASSSTTPTGAFHTQAKLGVTIAPGDNAKRPVAGIYSGTTTITLSVS